MSRPSNIFTHTVDAVVITDVIELGLVLALNRTHLSCAGTTTYTSTGMVKCDHRVVPVIHHFAFLLYVLPKMIVL